MHALLLALALLPPHCGGGRPRMSDPQWVRRAAELAGFSVRDCNLGTWIVKGRGRTGFYLWTSRGAAETHPRLGRLAGVALYGTSWRVWWRAQGLTVWLEYGPRISSTLPTRGRLANLVVVTKHLPRRYTPIRMMHTPSGPLAKCRSSRLLRPACPRSIPRIPGWRTYPSYGNRVKDTFGIESGGPFPKPELNRPPSMFHLEISADRSRDAKLVLPFRWPRRPIVTPHDGLTRGARQEPLAFGAFLWGGKRGTLTLAPGYPLGGSQGGHLIFRWRSGNVTYFVGLHAWEPLTETVSTLRRIVSSTPR